MDSDGLNQLKLSHMKKSARGVYRWLWFSPLLTIPTLALLLFSDMSITIAVLGSALWHLLLLRQALAKHTFVRWHGRQGLLLAGLRTAFSLVYGLLSYDEEGLALSILILIAIWLVGNIWGQDQVARGDCWLMRVRGQGDGLPLKWSPVAPARPQPSAEPSLARLAEAQRRAEVADLLAVFQIGDAASRSKALEQLKSMGEVEVF